MEQARPGIPFTETMRLDWLRLIRSENVGPATFSDLLRQYNTASAALEALPELAGRAGRKTLRIANQADAEAELERTHKKGARLVCLGESDYPPALRAADSPPPVLAVAGSGECLTKHAVAFVGSRNASLAGIKLTKQLAKETGAEGYSIVSGLARGIDAAAHEAALTTGTVAVFAGGIDHIYPRENERLAHAIVDQGGALITEMPFGWKPRAQDFPRRNRIVAGMALGLVVVEAARRSGSLISARLAAEAGRVVFAVPGSPLDPRSEGANHLIRNGAELITNSQHILDSLAPMKEMGQQTRYTLDETDRAEFQNQPTPSDEDVFVSALGHTPTDLDELIRHTGLAVGKVHLLVIQLELAGRLERHTGNRVSMI
ncbi:MAG: DNA-processing protein DprA [Pseudomonadota bacterium]